MRRLTLYLSFLLLSSSAVIGYLIYRDLLPKSVEALPLDTTGAAYTVYTLDTSKFAFVFKEVESNSVLELTSLEQAKTVTFDTNTINKDNLRLFLAEWVRGGNDQFSPPTACKYLSLFINPRLLENKGAATLLLDKVECEESEINTVPLFPQP